MCVHLFNTKLGEYRSNRAHNRHTAHHNKHSLNLPQLPPLSVIQKLEIQFRYAIVLFVVGDKINKNYSYDLKVFGRRITYRFNRLLPGDRVLAPDTLSGANNIKELSLDIPRTRREYILGGDYVSGFTEILRGLENFTSLNKFTLVLGRDSDHEICQRAPGWKEYLRDLSTTPWLNAEQAWASFKIKEGLKTDEDISKHLSPALMWPDKEPSYRDLSTSKGQTRFFDALDHGFGFSGKSHDCSAHPELPWKRFEFVWQAKPHETLVWRKDTGKCEKDGEKRGQKRLREGTE